jgi:hypothetical protein
MAIDRPQLDVFEFLGHTQGFLMPAERGSAIFG